MKIILSFICFCLLSCKSKTVKSNYETSIASSVYKAQMSYLDKTLYNYSRISDTGAFYWKQSSVLEAKTENFKNDLNDGQIISSEEQKEFFEYFEKTLNNYPLVDSDILQKIKRLPIQTASDIDLLQLYFKSYFVGILLNNKLLPFDTWGSMASAPNWTINDGESFIVELATTASNSNQLNDWFLVKNNIDNTLTKDNIIDTLHPDKFGTVFFETKKYKKGLNRLIFISRLKTPTQDRMVSREVIFHVK